MQMGYCYEYNPPTGGIATGLFWWESSDEHWDTVVYTPNGAECKVGDRKIDGSPCSVFLCSDDVIRAQTKVFLGGK